MKNYDVKKLIADLKKAGIKFWPQSVRPMFSLEVAGKPMFLEAQSVAVVLEAKADSKEVLKDLGAVLMAMHFVSPIYGFQSKPTVINDANGSSFAVAYPVFFKAVLPAIKAVQKDVMGRLGYKP